MKKKAIKTILCMLMLFVGAVEITFGVQDITRALEELGNKKEK